MMKLEDKDPMSNADVLLQVDSLAGYWTKFDKLRWKMNRPMIADALAAQKRTASSGTFEPENSTIARPFDPENKDDDAVIKWAEDQKCARQPFDFVIRPVTRCGTVTFRGSKAWYLTGCRIMSFETMSGLDLGGGGDLVELSIEFSWLSNVWR